MALEKNQSSINFSTEAVMPFTVEVDYWHVAKSIKKNYKIFSLSIVKFLLLKFNRWIQHQLTFSATNLSGKQQFPLIEQSLVILLVISEFLHINCLETKRTFLANTDFSSIAEL